MFCVRWKQECARSAHEKKATRHRMKFHSCFENFRYQNLISCFDLQIYNNCGFAFIRILNVRDERIWCIPRLHYIFCVKWRWWLSSQQQNDRRRRCRCRFFSFVLVFFFFFSRSSSCVYQNVSMDGPSVHRRSVKSCAHHSPHHYWFSAKRADISSGRVAAFTAQPNNMLHEIFCIHAWIKLIIGGAM